MAIELPPETAKQLKASIKRFFTENLDQDIGDLQARMVLNYSLKEIGPAIYNQAIADAQAYFQGRVADLESVCYEKEFTYWLPAPPKLKRGSAEGQRPNKRLEPPRRMIKE